MTEVSLLSLVKSYGKSIALKGISLSVGHGEFVSLLGPSGCGKSTTLKCIAGFEDISDGKILFDNTDISRRLPEQRDIGMVFQSYALFPHMTVAQNLAFGLEMRRVPKSEIATRVARAMEMVQLTPYAERFPKALSGGQQQRVGIVRALALQPSMLLFDEPTSSLDPELVGEVLAVMTELAGEGWTMAVVTHELGFAREVADQVSFFDEGVVVERGTPDRVFGAPEHERTRRFLQRLQGPFGR